MSEDLRKKRNLIEDHVSVSWNIEQVLSCMSYKVRRVKVFVSSFVAEGEVYEAPLIPHLFTASFALCGKPGPPRVSVALQLVHHVGVIHCNLAALDHVYGRGKDWFGLATYRSALNGYRLSLLILSSSAFPLGGEGALFLFFKCKPLLRSTFQQCLNFSIHWLLTVGSVSPLLQCPDSPLVQWGSLHNVGSSFRVWGQPGCGCLSSGSNCCCSPTAADWHQETARWEQLPDNSCFNSFNCKGSFTIFHHLSLMETSRTESHCPPSDIGV